jgi:hypothetical protein
MQVGTHMQLLFDRFGHTHADDAVSFEDVLSDDSTSTLDDVLG